MKNTMLKTLIIFLVLALPFLICGCGKAQYTGYNAPEGAAVNFNGYGTCTPVSLSTECSVVSVVTSRLTHDEVITTDPNTPAPQRGAEALHPVGQIQVYLGGSNVQVFHATNGSAWLLSDTPIEELTLPTMIKTNDNGFYQLRVCPSGSGELSANIGSSSCTATFE